jgi:hypothetical protein
VNILSICSKDVDEYVVERIKNQGDSWEPTEAMEDVQAFQDFCKKNPFFAYFFKEKQSQNMGLSPKGSVNLHLIALRVMGFNLELF